jgi:hypothetical protein
MIGEAASRAWTKGFLTISPDLSNIFCLQVSTPNTNMGKNMKKRGSMILKVLEININPKNNMEEINIKCFELFENMIIKG